RRAITRQKRFLYGVCKTLCRRRYPLAEDDDNTTRKDRPMKTALYFAAAAGFLAVAAGASPLFALAGAANLALAWLWNDGEDDDDERDFNGRMDAAWLGDRREGGR